MAVNFPVGKPDTEPRLGKESFMGADDAVQDDWSSNELPESILDLKYVKDAARKNHAALSAVDIQNLH